MKRLPRVKVPVSIGLTLELLAQIDEQATEENISRSEFITRVIKEKLEQQEK